MNILKSFYENMQRRYLDWVAKAPERAARKKEQLTYRLAREKEQAEIRGIQSKINTERNKHKPKPQSFELSPSFPSTDTKQKKDKGIFEGL